MNHSVLIVSHTSPVLLTNNMRVTITRVESDGLGLLVIVEGY